VPFSPAPSSQSLPRLSTVVAAASATVDVEATFDSTYDEYLIRVTDLVTANDNVNLLCRLKIGGAYLDTATYVWQLDMLSSAAATYLGLSALRNAPETAIKLASGVGNAAGEGMSFDMRVTNPAGAALMKKLFSRGSYIDRLAGEINRMDGVGFNTGTAALTGVRFFASVGNITSGTFRLYGIAK